MLPDHPRRYTVGPNTRFPPAACMHACMHARFDRSATRFRAARGLPALIARDALLATCGARGARGRAPARTRWRARGHSAAGVRAAPGCDCGCDWVTSFGSHRASVLDRCSAMALHKSGPADVALPVWRFPSVSSEPRPDRCEAPGVRPLRQRGKPAPGCPHRHGLRQSDVPPLAAPISPMRQSRRECRLGDQAEALVGAVDVVASVGRA